MAQNDSVHYVRYYGKTIKYGGQYLGAVDLRGTTTDDGNGEDPGAGGDATNLHIVFIGNSIWDGVSYYEAPEYFQDSSGYTVSNLASSGDRIADQLTAWQGLAQGTKDTTDFVVVGVGINDIAHDSYPVNESYMFQDYSDLIDTIDSEIPSGAIIIAFTLTPAKNSTYMSSQDVSEWSSFNTWLTDTYSGAAIVSNANALDLASVGDPAEMAASYHNGDHIHPNDDGHALIYQNVLDMINRDVNEHPMTHDQLYILHDNMANGDYVGEVYYLCTDSIFNDRSGAYSWSIISGNTGSAFSINGSTGMLTVNDYTAISDDFTLGVEISNNGYADTATCTMVYRTNCIYFDPSAETNGDGSFASPYNDVSAFDASGDWSGGETLLMKRGTSYQSTVNRLITIYNGSGNKIYIGAYGQGDRPRYYHDLSGAEADNRSYFLLGSTGAAPADANTADSVIIMDHEFTNDPDYDIRAIEVGEGSEYNQFHRQRHYSGGHNGAIYLNQEAGSPTFTYLQDIQIDSVDLNGGNREGIKSEATGTEIYNFWGFHASGKMLHLGDERGDDTNWSVAKYIYIDNGPGNGSGSIQIRDGYTKLEWFYVKDHWRNLSIVDNDYFTYDGKTNYPRLINIEVRNGILENAGATGMWFDSQDAIHAENITLENILMLDGASSAMYVDIPLDTIYIKNCIIVNNSGTGIYGNSDVDYMIVENCISYGNTTDINISGATSEVLRNTMYDVMTGTPATNDNNYDVGTSGNPWVDSSNGDYRTDTGETSIIDQGATPTYSSPDDIIGNDITTLDIGPFEYGGTGFNWTNR